jgi:hypothetical protein
MGFASDNTRVGKKRVFFYLKQNIQFFFILNSFFCLKYVLNLAKKKQVLNQF